MGKDGGGAGDRRAGAASGKELEATLLVGHGDGGGSERRRSRAEPRELAGRLRPRRRASSLPLMKPAAPMVPRLSGLEDGDEESAISVAPKADWAAGSSVATPAVTRPSVVVWMDGAAGIRPWLR